MSPSSGHRALVARPVSVPLRVRSITAAAIGLICAANAFAQQISNGPSQPSNVELSPVAAIDDEAASPSGGSQPVLGEIVVTAEKRTATVLGTPLSLTAISGADIQARGPTDFTSLVETVPGVSTLDQGPGQTQITMRGVDPAGGNSPTTGFYLGDTSLTAPAGANDGKVVIDPALYDLSRVEVLRGPQGTLYGASSMGGTVRLIPNDPDPNAFAASAQGIGSGTDGGGANGTANAMLNLPMLDGKAALRLVGTEQYTSGWIDRIVIAPGEFPLETNNFNTRGDVLAAPVAKNYKDANDEKLTAGRAVLLLKPIDTLKITPMVFYQHVTMGMPNIFDSVPGTLAHYEPYDIAEPYSDRTTLESLNINYQAPWFDVVSNTSYWDRLSVQTRDATEDLQDIFQNPSLYTFGPIVFTATDSSHQFSQEVRVVSPGDTRFTWIIGGYYSRFGSSGYNSSSDAGLIPIFGYANLFWKAIPIGISQRAAFGEASYEVLPGLRITAGLREYSYDTKETDYEDGVFRGTDQIETVVVQPSSNQGTNPKLDFSYHPNRDLMIYTTAAKGFRPGGGNQLPPTAGPTLAACNAQLAALGLSAEPQGYGPDSLWSYEAGEKARLAGGRVSLNSDVYREDWSQLQQKVSLNCGIDFTANAGAARIYGTEFELNALVTDGLVAGVSVGYSHGYLVEGSAAAGTVAGAKIQDVPNVTYNVNLSYTHAISDGLDLVSRIENSYVVERFESDMLSSYAPVPSYALTNARLGVRGGQWQASIFVDNVFDKHAILGITGTEAAGIPTFNNLVSNQPLTVGLDVSYQVP